MTEAEWAACDDPRPMTEVVLGSARAGDRTCRLCAAAIDAHISVVLLGLPVPTGASELAVALETWADTGDAGEPIREYQAYGVALADADARAALRGATALPDEVDEADGRAAAKAGVVSALREVFGDPFRPVTFSTAWRTDTAVSIARQMYDSRDFSAMPILADALQDAGCDEEQVLTHCRDAGGMHVRGCWVVDLVLGEK